MTRANSIAVSIYCCECNVFIINESEEYAGHVGSYTLCNNCEYAKYIEDKQEGAA